MRLAGDYSFLKYSLVIKLALIKLNKSRHDLNVERMLLNKEVLPMYEALKVKQIQCLQILCDRKHLFANLPTGFGKSLIIELLPYLGDTESGKTIIVSPLNAIISEMIDRYGRNVHRVTNDSLHDAQFKMCDFLYFIGHPEHILSKGTCNIMKRWNNTVNWIVIDEAHLIVQWGSEFRKDYQRLCKLRALFPRAVVVALTATCNKQTMEFVKSSLNVDVSMM